MSEQTWRGGHDVYELDELLGAYALDAVDDDDRRRVDDYLAVNPRAAAEVQEHREVATMLAFTGMDAPAGLWDRIASELEDTAPEPGPELAKILPIERAAERRRSRARTILPWLAATAAAAVVAVTVVSVFDRGESPGDPLTAAAEAARTDRDSRTAELRADGSDVVVEAVIDNDGHGFLFGDALPELGDDRTYQLWGVVGEQVISIGILGPHPELETFTVRDDLVALAVTIEPAGGVISDGNPDGAFVGELA
ncbi:MAG: anti-sigma factor [Ilumatobacteraceae bacterium]|jgi:anti-sigma-K factor RskA|nr:anti-sigma factor [Ilumatobacteraceae bacterium]